MCALIYHLIYIIIYDSQYSIKSTGSSNVHCLIFTLSLIGIGKSKIVILDICGLNHVLDRYNLYSALKKTFDSQNHIFVQPKRIKDWWEVRNHYTYSISILGAKKVYTYFDIRYLKYSPR